MSRQPARCGTYSGYMRHIRLREKACDGCAEASRIYHRKYDKVRYYRGPVVLTGHRKPDPDLEAPPEGLGVLKCSCGKPYRDHKITEYHR